VRKRVNKSRKVRKKQAVVAMVQRGADVRSSDTLSASGLRDRLLVASVMVRALHDLGLEPATEYIAVAGSLILPQLLSHKAPLHAGARQ